MAADHHRRILPLNSTHGRYIRGCDPWVRATLDALARIDPGSQRVITSVGLANWELAAVAAADAGLSQLLIVPGDDDSAGRLYFRRCLAELGLDEDSTRPAFAGRTDGRRFRGLRDRLAFELADEVRPVSVRPGGRLEALLDEFSDRGKPVDGGSRVEYSGGGWRPGWRFDGRALNPDLAEFSDGWLTHWTISHPGPWPGEPAGSFYRAVLADPENYVRSAPATLRRILAEGRIRGSGGKMAGAEPTVSLTAAPPADSVPLMRWRSRWRRWSIEPFGIAFRAQALVSRGVREVRYVDSLPAGTPPRERIFIQLRGKSADWSAEREWRVHGDIALDGIAAEDTALLVYDAAAAERFRDIAAGRRVAPLVV